MYDIGVELSKTILHFFDSRDVDVQNLETIIQQILADVCLVLLGFATNARLLEILLVSAS
jgi:hypothetical protein